MLYNYSENLYEGFGIVKFIKLLQFSLYNTRTNYLIYTFVVSFFLISINPENLKMKFAPVKVLFTTIYVQMCCLEKLTKI